MDPSQRLTCSQALSHPYLASLDKQQGGQAAAAASGRVMSGSQAESSMHGGRGGRKGSVVAGQQGGDPMDEDMPSPPARYGGCAVGQGSKGQGQGRHGAVPYSAAARWSL